MAKFQLTDFIDVGAHGYHDATSWRVTKDAAGLDIIDESLHDTENLYIWDSPLPDGQGGFYADLDEVYLWVKVHILESESPWFCAPVANQNDQTFGITENGGLVNTINSLVEGIQ